MEKVFTGKTAEEAIAAGLAEMGLNREDAEIVVLDEGKKGGLFGIGAAPAQVSIKRVERLNVPEAMKQAMRDAEKFHDGAPTLFHRRSREPWLVTMRLQDWIELYRTQSEQRKTAPNE